MFSVGMLSPRVDKYTHFNAPNTLTVPRVCDELWTNLGARLNHLVYKVTAA